jgi:hypothetical protein
MRSWPIEQELTVHSAYTDFTPGSPSCPGPTCVVMSFKVTIYVSTQI